MRLSPPTTAVWWVSLILVVLAILLQLGVVMISGITQYAFWIVVLVAFLLLVATRVENL
jgi:predicted RND superfamily exporter protein